MHKYNFTIEKFANWNDIEKWEYANCVAKCICRVQWLPLVKMMGFISVQFFRSSMCENGAKAAFRFRCVKYSTIMLLKFWNCDRYWSGYGEIGTCTQYPILQDIFERRPPRRFLHHISMTSAIRPTNCICNLKPPKPDAEGISNVPGCKRVSETPFTYLFVLHCCAESSLARLYAQSHTDELLVWRVGCMQD